MQTYLSLISRNIAKRLFKFTHSLDIVKKHRKWMDVNPIDHFSGGSSKRAIIPLKGAYTSFGSAFDLNEDFCHSFQFLQWPLGKKKPSKAAKNVVSKMTSATLGQSSNKVEFRDLKEEIRKSNAFKEMEQDLQILI